MFESLTGKLSQIFKDLRGYGKLSENNIKDALREIRITLLEADVNFKVVKSLVESVKKRAVGQEVLNSITPGQQMFKIVHEELIDLLGRRNEGLKLSGKQPVSLMLVGLQGTGKTVTVGKLAKLLKGRGRNPYLVPADIYRPAAIEQLQLLGDQLEIEVYHPDENERPPEICQNALSFARNNGFDTLIIDTAGRLHIDEELMKELQDIKERIDPNEILFVADAMAGQDAVNVASKFNELLEINGVILTKMDGDARGGAALSIKAVTGKPIKFLGTGEKLDAIEDFHPDRVASRILGMGDLISLVEKVQKTFEKEQARELKGKIQRETFTLEDFRYQLKQIRRMGSLEDIIGMVPGVGRIKETGNLKPANKELIKVGAIIDSMTKKERMDHTILNGSRRRRIAKGSGTTVQDVNRLIANFLQMKKMMKRFKKSGIKGLRRGILPF
jgi:signal recognition particle subunit SRP54